MAVSIVFFRLVPRDAPFLPPLLPCALPNDTFFSRLYPKMRFAIQRNSVSFNDTPVRGASQDKHDGGGNTPRPVVEQRRCDLPQQPVADLPPTNDLSDDPPPFMRNVIKMVVQEVLRSSGVIRPSSPIDDGVQERPARVPLRSRSLRRRHQPRGQHEQSRPCPRPSPRIRAPAHEEHRLVGMPRRQERRCAAASRSRSPRRRRNRRHEAMRGTTRPSPFPSRCERDAQRKTGRMGTRRYADSRHGSRPRYREDNRHQTTRRPNRPVLEPLSSDPRRYSPKKSWPHRSMRPRSRSRRNPPQRYRRQSSAEQYLSHDNAFNRSFAERVHRQTHRAENPLTHGPQFKEDRPSPVNWTFPFNFPRKRRHDPYQRRLQRGWFMAGKD